MTEKNKKATQLFWASMTPEQRHFELSRRAKKAWARRPQAVKDAHARKMVEARKKLSTA